MIPAELLSNDPPSFKFKVPSCLLREADKFFYIEISKKQRVNSSSHALEFLQLRLIKSDEKLFF